VARQKAKEDARVIGNRISVALSGSFERKVIAWDARGKKGGGFISSEEKRWNAYGAGGKRAFAGFDQREKLGLALGRNVCCRKGGKDS